MRRRLALAVAAVLAMSGLNVSLATSASAAPQAPTSLTVERVPDGYKLTWAKVPGATGYRIYLAEANRARMDRHRGDNYGWVVRGHRWVTERAVGNRTTYIVRSYPGASEITRGWESAPFAVAAYNSSGTGEKQTARAQCANGYFISARGTHQNPSSKADKKKYEKDIRRYKHGLGNRGDRVYKQALKRLDLPESQFQATALGYPAGFPNYGESVNLGRDATASRVRSITTKCPDARIVLFGYSQGAQAVGNGFQLLSPKERAKVTQMHLFADPRRRINDPNVDYQPSNAGRAGVYRARAHFSDTRKPQVVSWCWSGDDVCSMKPFSGAEPFTLHSIRSEESDAYDCYEKHAALRIAQRARSVGWLPRADTTAEGCTMVI